MPSEFQFHSLRLPKGKATCQPAPVASDPHQTATRPLPDRWKTTSRSRLSRAMIPALERHRPALCRWKNPKRHTLPQHQESGASSLYKPCSPLQDMSGNLQICVRMKRLYSAMFITSSMIHMFLRRSSNSQAETHLALLYFYLSISIC